MGKRTMAAVAAALFASAAHAATVVLKVNGAGITDAELQQARHSVEAAGGGKPLDPRTALRMAVDQVVGHALLVQAARESGITIDPKEAQARLNAQRSRYATPEAFAQSLAARGMGEADAARFEEENLLILRYTEAKVAPSVSITREEARAYYDANPSEFDHPEQVRVQMILAAVPPNATPEVDAEARARAQMAAARLADGEDFDRVAREVSDDPTRSRGGEVGWVAAGKLLPELDGPVFSLKPGEVTGVIKTKYGYHIMRSAERRAGGRSSFEEVEKTLTDMLKGNKVRQALAQVIAERRAKAKIETLDPEIQAVLGPIANAAGGQQRP